jgi:hypothetical protein
VAAVPTLQHRDRRRTQRTNKTNRNRKGELSRRSSHESIKVIRRRIFREPEPRRRKVHGFLPIASDRRRHAAVVFQRHFDLVGTRREIAAVFRTPTCHFEVGGFGEEDVCPEGIFGLRDELFFCQERRTEGRRRREGRTHS